MNGGGRPTVITNNTVQKLEEAFKAGFSVSEACLVADISRATFYTHKASNPAFSDKIELAKQYVTIRAKKVVLQAIDEGNFNAAKWWLEHRARNEFGTSNVDEDAQWEAQCKIDDEDDSLKQIVDSMKALANETIAETEAKEELLTSQLV